MKALKKIVSILPWVLTVIAVISAVVIFVYADRAQIDHDTETKVAELQKSNADLQSTVDGLQSNVDSLQGNVDNLQSTVNGLQEEIDSKYSGDELWWGLQFKAEDMEELIASMPADDANAIDLIAAELFDRAAGRIGYIRYNGTEFLPFVNHSSNDPDFEITRGERTYSKCDMLYSDFVKIYSDVFTGEALDDFLNWMFTEKDGYLYAVYGGGMTGIGIENIKLTRISEKGNEIKYGITFDYSCFNSAVNADSCSMTIRLENGVYKVSEIDYLNIKDYWND